MTGALLIATVLVVFASPPPSAEPAPIAPPTRAIVSPKKSALTRGEAALAAGDYAAADEALEEALTIEPSNWNALHGAGLAARKTKKYERAKERLLRAVDLASGPRDAALAQFELACVETQLGQLDSAVSRLRKAISLVGVESFKDALEADEDLAPLRSRADFARLKRGLTDKPDLLVQPGESLLALSNLSVKMLNDSHQATLAADYERAAKCLERCVKAQPNAHPCYLRLAEVYALRFRRDKDPLSQQKSKEAYQHFLQVAPANDPSVPGVWELLRR
jgi:tetratricopeptide (TPR) repeat protein